MRKLNIPDEMLERFLYYRKFEAKTVYAATSLLREEFPGVFPDKTSNPSAYRLIWCRLRDLRLRGELDALNVPEPDADIPERLGVVTVPYQDFAVMSDWHVPYHDKALTERLLYICKRRKIRLLIINGDFFDNDWCSVYQSAKSGDMNLSFQKAGQLYGSIVKAGFTTVVKHMGNHEKRLEKTIGQMGLWNMIQMGLSATDDEGERVLSYEDERIFRQHLKYSDSFHSYVEAGPDGVPWAVTHQKEYHRQAGSSTRKYAGRFRREKMEHYHFITGHDHHLGLSLAEDGYHWAVSAGCGLDPTLPEYVNRRMTLHPYFCPGFVLVQDGVPEIFRADNPDEWWDRQLAVKMPANRHIAGV